MSKLTRRRLLLNAGTGVLGISVLHTLSACSSADPAPAPAPGTPPPPPAGSPSAASPSAATGPLTWERVDLQFVAAYLLVRGDEVAVVDLGTPGSASAIQAGLTAAGHNWGAVKHVILTHKHDDHAGGLADVAPQVAAAAIHAGQADIAGITSPTRLRPVADGDEVFGLRIIGTPGHTAGHVSVFDPGTRVLVAGDALTNDGGLKGSNPQYTEDGTAAAASVRKLAALGATTILPGHGAPITEGAPEALSRLAGG